MAAMPSRSCRSDRGHGRSHGKGLARQLHLFDRHSVCRGYFLRHAADRSRWRSDASWPNMACVEFPRSHALRRGRWSESGRVYLVTLVAAGRRAHFTRWEAASLVSRCLADPLAWHDSTLLCWVLMPDHWHGLVQLGVNESLSRNVGRAKASVSRAWPRDPGGKGSPWQSGFHDRALLADEQLLAAVRYVVANPLRAGLARRLGDYPFWNAIWL